MKVEEHPIDEINRRATDVLVRELGVADTLRFLTQFGGGVGNYTEERAAWLDQLSVAQIADEIRAMRRAAK